MAEFKIPEILDLGKCFEDEPPELDFVLPGLLTGTVGALIGTGGTSKSTFMLQAALMLAGGTDTLGVQDIDSKWKRKPVDRICYVAAEDPEPILHRRTSALGAFMPPEKRELVKCALEVHCAHGYLLEIAENPLWQKWIMDIARGTRLVVIDTLRRVHQLDENESGAMAKLMGQLEHVCKETGTTVLFVHHTNKTGAGDSEASSSRGSSVLTDNARLVLKLVTMNDKEASRFGVDEEFRRFYVKLVYAEQNYCAPYPDRWFKRCEEGRLEPVTFGKPMKKGGGSYTGENDEDNW